MLTPDPSGWLGKLVRAIRVKTHLEFLALVLVLVWTVCMVGLYRGGTEGMLAFLAAFVWIAVVTILGTRSKDS